MKNSVTVSRRFAVTSAAALAGIAVVKGPLFAAPQFHYRYGNDQTDQSPTTIRSIQMWKAIEQETGGKLVVDTFPNSVLGGDSQMIGQLRTGALNFLTEVGALLGGVVPASQIDGIPFAFKDSKTAFAAVDGELGDYIRKEIAAKGMVCLANPFDNGFRHITANKPVRTVADIDGVKIRVPTSPLFVEMFKALGASPTPINVSELYTALQTHIVDAQENALFNIEQSKLYEVQKTLNFSYHSWSGWWMLAHKDSWDALGADIQAVIQRNQRKYALLQRDDFAKATLQLTNTLKGQGMTTYDVNVATFKPKLSAFYTKFKGEFGTTGWALLEKYAGPLG